MGPLHWLQAQCQEIAVQNVAVAAEFVDHEPLCGQALPPKRQFMPGAAAHKIVA
jgi:hypothetical protein